MGWQKIPYCRLTVDHCAGKWAGAAATAPLSGLLWVTIAALFNTYPTERLAWTLYKQNAIVLTLTQLHEPVFGLQRSLSQCSPRGKGETTSKQPETMNLLLIEIGKLQSQMVPCYLTSDRTHTRVKYIQNQLYSIKRCLSQLSKCHHYRRRPKRSNTGTPSLSFNAKLSCLLNIDSICIIIPIPLTLRFKQSALEWGEWYQIYCVLFSHDVHRGRLLCIQNHTLPHRGDSRLKKLNYLWKS